MPTIGGVFVVLINNVVVKPSSIVLSANAGDTPPWRLTLPPEKPPQTVTPPEMNPPVDVHTPEITPLGRQPRTPPGDEPPQLMYIPRRKPPSVLAKLLSRKTLKNLSVYSIVSFFAAKNYASLVHRPAALLCAPN